MPDTEIPNLTTSHGAATTGDLVHAVRSGNSGQATLGDLAGKDEANVVNATTVAAVIDGATAKATPVDADTMPLIDSEASNALKKLTWANLKATLQGLFASAGSALTDNAIVRGDGGSRGVQTSGVTIDDSDNMVVPGSITVTAGQIVFPATQNASADPNTIDDYEEGTWTPTYTTDGVDFSSVTYDPVTTGWYTKVGQMVALGFHLRTDAITVGSASGNVIMGGLPFTPDTDNAHGVALGYTVGFAGDHPIAADYVEASGLYFRYRTTVNGAAATMNVADMATGANANDTRGSTIIRV